MAEATGNEYIWAFVRYAEANPYNSLNSVHWDEIKKMLAYYSAVNLTGGSTATATDPLTYDATTDLPGKSTANTDDAGIEMPLSSTAKTDQLLYPEMHVFTAVPAN